MSVTSGSIIAFENRLFILFYQMKIAGDEKQRSEQPKDLLTRGKSFYLGQ